MLDLKKIFTFNFSLHLQQKIQIAIVLLTMSVFVIAISIISIGVKDTINNSAFRYVDAKADESSITLTNKLENNLHISHTLAASFQNITQYDIETRNSIITNNLTQILLKNPDFISVWVNFVFSEWTHGEWTKEIGRVRYSAYKNQNGEPPLIIIDTTDLEQESTTTNYYRIKKEKLPSIYNPYFDKVLTEKHLFETSLAAPIIKDEVFMGLTGVDIELSYFQEYVSTIQPYSQSYAMLIANNGVFVGHPDSTLIGDSIIKIISEEKRDTILNCIKTGKKYSFITNNTESQEQKYVVFSPVFINGTTTPWSLALVTPVTEIRHEANKSILFSLAAGVIGVLISLIITYFLALQVSRPVIEMTDVLKQISKGHLLQNLSSSDESTIEFMDMYNTVNQLIIGLRKKGEIAETIGNGNLEVNIELLSNNDTLGHSLRSMQQSLKKARNEEANYQEEQSRRRWYNEGITKFSDILRRFNRNIDELSFELLRNLISYVNCVAGAIYIYEKESNSLIMSASYAYEKRKFSKIKHEIGQGLVGACAFENLPIYITEIPDNYIRIVSGFGVAPPKSILLVPVINEAKIMGVVELASFEYIEKYKQDFVETFADNFASTLNAMYINFETNQLLEQFKVQTTQMHTQELEMRSKIKELRETIEEQKKQIFESKRKIDVYAGIVLWAEYSLKGKLIAVNKNYMNFFGIDEFSLSEMNFEREMKICVSNETEGDFKTMLNKLRNGIAIKRNAIYQIDGKLRLLFESFSLSTDVDGGKRIERVSFELTENQEQY